MTLLFYGGIGAVIGGVIASQAKSEEGKEISAVNKIAIGAGIGGAIAGVVYLSVVNNPYLRMFNAALDVRDGMKKQTN